MNITGKKVLVTGGARGIGFEIACLFAQHRADVVVIDSVPPTPEERLADKRYHANSRLKFIKLDIRQKELVDQFANDYQVGEPFDILVNNAAITSGDNHKEIIDVNCIGTVNITEAILRRMKGRTWNGERIGGNIIFVTSVHTAVAFADDAAYDASKHWAVGYMRALALKYAPDLIRVNAVAPGSIAPQKVNPKSILLAEEAKKKIPLGKQGTGRDVAKAVLFLASDDASYITGTELRVDGGLSVKNALVD